MKNKQNRLVFQGGIGKVPLVLFFSAGIILSDCVLEAKPESAKARLPIQFELSLLEDGSYRGSYGMADGQYTVDIAIEAHRLKAVTVIEGPERVLNQKCGLCEAKAMIKETIETQSLPVDAYSGATRTTIAILRAVEAALSAPFSGADDTASPSEAWR